MSWMLDMGLAAALWADHHPPTPQASPSRCLRTLPSWNQAPHAEESLSSQGKVTSQSPKCSFLVLLHPRTRPERHQTLPVPGPSPSMSLQLAQLLTFAQLVL